MSTTYDPFFDTDMCVMKLFEQYKKHKNILVAFDYDDTLHDYHKKGYTFPAVVKLLRQCSRLGFTMILWTGNEDIPAILKDLKEYDIRVDHINCSSVEVEKKKPYFNILLDNNAGLGQAYNVLQQVVNMVISEKRKEQTSEPISV